MATLLLLVIYCGYIGLGIPDALIGASWPAMQMDFALPISYANFVSTIAGFGTIVTSFLSARLIKKFGTRVIVAFSTGLTAAALLGFSVSGNFIFVCLFAIPMGLGAGAVDSSLNNFVALHYSARHMSFLHCFYGVGVSVSPYLMSYALKTTAEWRFGFRYAFFIQLGITAVMVLSFPLWNRANGIAISDEKDIEVLKTRDLVKKKGVMTIGWCFFGSCAVEVICNVWGPSFLVKVKGYTAAQGAALIVLYFVGLSLGRLVSGLLVNKITPVRIMLTGEILTILAIVALLLPLARTVAPVALFFVGFGNGPAYPNLTHLIPKIFGNRLSQSVIGFEMAFAYVSILGVPVLFGQIAQRISIGLFGWTLLAFYLLMMVNMIAIAKEVKSKEIKQT